MAAKRRRLRKQPAALEITAFINLIVVLVPFLLSTAVFTRLAVMELKVPPQSSSFNELKVDELKLEVVIRKDAIEVGDRIGGLIQRLPAAAAGTPDLKALAALMHDLKARFPAQRDASVLAEPDTPYDTLVQVMDAVRTGPARSVDAGTHGGAVAELFPAISVGDAPRRAAVANR